MKKIMETKKKKYVKPKLTVAEWDFNEAVCTDQTMWRSYCPHIEGSNGSQTRHDHIYTNDGNIQWERFPNN